MGRKVTTIDEYLETVSADKRSALEDLRKKIRSIIPDAEECISYSIPAFRLRGTVVAGFCARAKGCSYFRPCTKAGDDGAAETKRRNAETDALFRVWDDRSNLFSEVLERRALISAYGLKVFIDRCNFSAHAALGDLLKVLLRANYSWTPASIRRDAYVEKKSSCRSDNRRSVNFDAPLPHRNCRGRPCGRAAHRPRRAAKRRSGCASWSRR